MVTTGLASGKPNRAPRSESWSTTVGVSTRRFGTRSLRLISVAPPWGMQFGGAGRTGQIPRHACPHQSRHCMHSLSISLHQLWRPSYALCAYFQVDFTVTTSMRSAITTTRQAVNMQAHCKTHHSWLCCEASMKASMHSTRTPMRMRLSTSSGSSGIHMAYLTEHIEQDRPKRDEIVQQARRPRSQDSNECCKSSMRTLTSSV